MSYTIIRRLLGQARCEIDRAEKELERTVAAVPSLELSPEVMNALDDDLTEVRVRVDSLEARVHAIEQRDVGGFNS